MDKLLEEFFVTPTADNTITFDVYPSTATSGNFISPQSASSLQLNLQRSCCEFIGGYNVKTSASILNVIYPLLFPKHLSITSIDEFVKFEYEIVIPYVQFLNELGMPIEYLGVKYSHASSYTAKHKANTLTPVMVFKMESRNFVNKTHTLSSFTCLRYLWHPYHKNIPNKVLEFVLKSRGVLTHMSILMLAHYHSNHYGDKCMFGKTPYFIHGTQQIKKAEDYVNKCSKYLHIQTMFVTRDRNGYTPAEYSHYMPKLSFVTTQQLSKRYPGQLSFNPTILRAYNEIYWKSGMAADRIQKEIQDLHIHLLGMLELGRDNTISSLIKQIEQLNILDLNTKSLTSILTWKN